ncbi:MAG: SDR family NAD(P)-dependent oxidoreductase [Chloroflexi bacterium]|nr:SDR family NAD(P)-dependent oxidoreductase [Chloroflexota bacterium]
MTDYIEENTNLGSEEEVEATGIDRRQFLTGSGVAAAALGIGLAAGASPAQAQEAAGEGEFAGRCAFITGGARGIGLATAEVLAQAGANIVIYDIAGPIEHVPYDMASEEDLANAKATIEGYGVQCMAIQGDVRDGDLLKESANQAVSEFGSLDFMFANAGITQVGTLDVFNKDEIDVVLDINLGGVIKTVQAAIPIMREQNSGRIILTASYTGRRGEPFSPIYSSTKWGVVGLAKGTALLMGSHNVTCNAIAPSIVRTKLLDNPYFLNFVSPDNPSWEIFSNWTQETLHALPVGSFDAIHVANVVRFLCSDAAALISGDVFDIGAGVNATYTA